MIATILLALPLSSPPALPQVPVWNEVTPGAAPGTEAELVLDAANSTPARTTLELRVHGFWSETIVGPDSATYQRLTFPGLGWTDVVGDPELPVARTRIGVVTPAASATLTGTTLPQGEVSFAAVLVHPLPVLALDSPGTGDPDGTPEQWPTLSPVYGSSTLHPASAATPLSPVVTRFGSLESAAVELFPARWEPDTLRLHVAPVLRASFDHPGTPSLQAPISPDRTAVAKKTHVNWVMIEAFNHPSLDGIVDRYLIVTRESLVPALDDFVLHRKRRGSDVDVHAFPDAQAVTPALLEATIATWWESGSAAQDAFCLLVGDTDSLPYDEPGVPGVTIFSDTPYWNAGGQAGEDRAIVLGRIPTNVANRVEAQLAKSIAYENDHDPTHDFGRALLVTHTGGYASQADAIEKLLIDAGNPVQLATAVGSDPAVDNAMLAAELAQSPGLLCYRGHGTSLAFPDWNTLGEDFLAPDLAAGGGAMPPLVWLIACNQAQDSSGTSALAELWMDDANGAAAVLAMTANVPRRPNDTLAEALFQGAFVDGLRTHGALLALARDRQWQLHGAQAELSLAAQVFLGDPALTVRSQAGPPPFQLLSPDPIPASGQPQPVTLQVLDAQGFGVPGVRVGAFKASFLPEVDDEVLTSGITDQDGSVTFPGPFTLGCWDWSAKDPDGSVAEETVGTQTGSFTSLGDGLEGYLGNAPVLSSGSPLAPGTSLTVNLDAARPVTTGALFISFTDQPMPALGGIFHTYPQAISAPIATGPIGNWVYQVAAVPALPSGFELYWQAWLIDPDAVQNVAFSNALRSEVP